MKRETALAVGAGALIGAGLGLLLGRATDPPPPDRIGPGPGILFTRGRIPVPTRGFAIPRPAPATAGELADRARLVRVLVYRVRQGEITIRSPEIPAHLQADVADLLERPAAPPAAAAAGALPLDWID